jgi:hypothetical protein
MNKMHNRCKSDNRFTHYFGGTIYWCLCVIWGLRHEVGENCVLVGHYAAMEMICCPETPLRNYHSLLHNNPQKRSSTFHWYMFWQFVENEISDKYTCFTIWKMGNFSCFICYIDKKCIYENKGVKLFFFYSQSLVLNKGGWSEYTS